MTNLEMNRNISDFIGTYCYNNGIPITKFAEKCEIPYMTLKRIIACNVQKVDVYTIVKIAMVTQTPLLEILGYHNENIDLFKRIEESTPYNRQILSSILDTLDDIHMAGRESKEIAFVDLGCDHTSYLLEYRYLKTEGLNYEQMQKLSFRSTFKEGFEYCAFRLPDNTLHPFYHKGSLLLVRQEEPQDNEIGAFVWKDEGYIRMIFRRVHKNGRFTELLPFTGRGRTYLIDTADPEDMMNWIKIGTVAGVIR